MKLIIIVFTFSLFLALSVVLTHNNQAEINHCRVTSINKNICDSHGLRQP